MYSGGSDSASSAVVSTQMSSPMPNYLRANRKRLALSQDDVAFLLGTETGEMVCRHEHFLQQPKLEVALAYEAVLGKPVRELFAGIYRRIELQVVARAKALARRTGDSTPGRRNRRKRQSVLAIATGTRKPELKP